VVLLPIGKQRPAANAININSSSGSNSLKLMKKHCEKNARIICGFLKFLKNENSPTCWTQVGTNASSGIMEATKKMFFLQFEGKRR
jgi:hypothetical protein